MRAEKFRAYELYTLYRDQLRDALDADRDHRELRMNGLIDSAYLNGLWTAVEREGIRANEEAARGDS